MDLNHPAIDAVVVNSLQIKEEPVWSKKMSIKEQKKKYSLIMRDKIFPRCFDHSFLYSSHEVTDNQCK